jgi:glycosyltransferase involved in cell wall biosynthesis
VDGPAALHKVAGQRSGLVALKPGVLFVHHHPPHLHLGSDRRLLALLEQMVRGGYRPSFAGVDDYDPGPVRGRTRLSELGVPLLAPIVTGEDLLDWVRHHDVAVVVLLLWFWKKASVPALYLRKLRTQLPHVKIVVMSDDVHFRRFMLRDEHEGGPVRGAGREQSADALKEEELRHYYHADHVLAISDFDIREIRAAGKHMDAARFTTLRHVHDEPVLFPLRAALPFASRRGVLFVGNVNNPTNLHGLRWFVTAVMPLLRRVEPNLRLTVAGSWDGEEARGSELHQLLRASGCVDVLGYVADLRDVLQRARVFVVPVLWATGVITKQTFAHVHGLPTVATVAAAQHAAPAPLGADGVASVWSHRTGTFEKIRVASVAASAEAFAAATLHLYHNQSAWNELRDNAARFARSGGGRGVCPSGILGDIATFFRKMEAGTC